MHSEPDITGPSWVSLHEAAERLSRYRGDFTQFTLNQLLTRGRVPVLSVRRDVVGALPDRVEGLLAKASSIDVVSHNNWILAHYRFASEQDAQKVLGPQSCFTWGAPVSGGLIVNLDFDQVQLCWATLIGELRRVGWIPADEAALRKLGLWPDSWGPNDSGTADEAPHVAEPRRDTGRPAPVRPPVPSLEQKRGPPPIKRLRVEAAMRDTIGDDSDEAQALRSAKEEELAIVHKVSRDTARRARAKVLSEFELRQTSTIDK